MASRPRRLDPPHQAPAVDQGGMTSQAWTEHHQAVADRLEELAASLPVIVRAGVTDGGEAAQGQIGEVLTAEVAPDGAVALAALAPVNIASLALGAGDWEVSGVVVFSPQGGAAAQAIAAWVSESDGGPGASNAGVQQIQGAFGASGGQVLQTGVRRASSASASTAFLGAMANWTGGTGMLAHGHMSARRVR